MSIKNMKKNILVIGGKGYIGSKISKDLSNEHDVHIMDLCWFDEPESNTIVSDFGMMDKSFYSQFNSVILLAGHSSVKMCEGNINYSYDNNVRNFINLFSNLSSNQQVIYASSSSVYGNAGENKVDENYHDFIPHNHYDITKHVIDLYAPKFDVQYYGLRFGTVNGFSSNMRKDVMINSMVYNALTDGEIKLYIKDIMRPILGINDLSRAIQEIVNCSEDKRGIYNLASFNKTAEEIAYGVSSVVNVPVKEYMSDPFSIKNSKLETKSYNFSIDSTKFCENFNFKFTDTIETITDGILQNFNNINFTDRSNIQEYGK
jgi:nucleoside-diphosphate-sugar epimerase